MLFVDKEDAKLRKDICYKCHNNKLGICSECGCIIATKIKLCYTYCPIKKWGRVVAKSDIAWDFNENIE